MRAVIGGKDKAPAGRDHGISIRVLGKPGKTLRQRLAAEQGERAAGEGAAGYFALALIGKDPDQGAGCIRASRSTGSSAAHSAAAKATPSSSISCSGKTWNGSRQPNALTFTTAIRHHATNSPSGSASSAVISATDMVFRSSIKRQPLPGDADRP